jgi:hypothetical protein
MQNFFIVLAIIAAIVTGKIANNENNVSDTQIPTAEGPRYQ